MATAHKRTLFLQLVGLNKQDDNFHSMMESCASFDTSGVPSVERNAEEKAPRKTAISKRVSDLKKKLGTTTTTQKRETDTEISFHGETTDMKQSSGTSSRSKSKSPAPRRGTGDTESHSDLESVHSEEDARTIDGMSVVSQLKVTDSKMAEDSTKRKRRSFFSGFLLPGHHSAKTLDQPISTRKLEHESHPLNESLSSKQPKERHPLNESFSSKQHMSPRTRSVRSNPLNESLSSKQQNESHQLNESLSSKQHVSPRTRLVRSNPLNESLTSKQQNESHQLNESLSSKQHVSPRTRVVRSRTREAESHRADEKESSDTPISRSLKPVRRRKVKDEPEQLNGKNRASPHSSQSSRLYQSKEMEVDSEILHEIRSFDLPSQQSFSMQESQRSRLDESQTSFKNADGVVIGTGLGTPASSRQSPRSRKPRMAGEKRESRRSLSPRRRLKQDTESGDAGEAGPSLSKDKSPKKRGSSPRRKKTPQNLSSLQDNSDVDAKPKKSESHATLTPANGFNASEDNEWLTGDEAIQLRDTIDTSLRKSSDNQDISESNLRGEFDSLQTKPRGRQNAEKAPTRRSRSVAALVRTRQVPKSRDLSLSPDKQNKGRITREGEKEDSLKDLRLKLEQSPFEKRPRGSSKSLGPGKELSLQNMLDAAVPVTDRKCLTVVSPKDYEKKKSSTIEHDEIVTTEHTAPSPSTTREGLKKLVRRLSPKKSPSLRHGVTTFPESLKVSPRTPTNCPTKPMAATQESSKVASRKSPSSSRTRIAAADELDRTKEDGLVMDSDPRGRARSRVEQLKEENSGTQQARSRSSSRHKKDRKGAAPNEAEIEKETHMASPMKSSGILHQSQSPKLPGTTLKNVLRQSSPSKSTRTSAIALVDSLRDSTLGKSQKPSAAQRQEGLLLVSKVSPKSTSSPSPDKTTCLQSQIKVSTHSTPEKQEVRRPRRSTSKSPGRQATQLHRQRNSPKAPDDPQISKRNEHFIRKAMSARNIDGHQTFYFEIEELNKSGTVVKRKLKVVPAGDAETLGSALLRKETSRGAHKNKDGPVRSVAAQLHIPELDESQKSNLKVKYTEYNEISMMDNYVDDAEESESI